MPMKPEEILEKSDDSDWLREFLKFSDTAITANMNQTRVASEIYLAQTITNSTAELKETVVHLSDRLEASLGKHADALIQSATSANEHARSLKVATWALVLATACLILVAWLK